jgi:hypothetical protein
MARKGRVHAPTVTSPAKMGEAMAHPRAVAAESPNVQYRPRGGSKQSAVPATKNNRTGVLTQDTGRERLGAKWAPQMAMGSPEVLPSAQETQRNVRLVRSAIGNVDFWSKRQFGQRMQ